MQVFRGQQRPRPDVSQYPKTPEDCPADSEIGRRLRAMQKFDAEYEEIRQQTGRYEQRRKECLALIRAATPDSDFVALAGLAMEAQVLENVLKPLLAERKRAGENSDYHRGEFRRVWGQYQSCLLELMQGSSLVDRRPEHVRADLEKLL